MGIFSILLFVTYCMKASEEDDSSARLLPEFSNCNINSETVHSMMGRKKIGIIGGGVSGLTALKVLHENGVHEVMLFEAQERLGGRVQTIRDGSIILENGAQWIHGGVANPIHKIAKKLNAVGTSSATLFETIDERLIKSDGNSLNAADLNGWETVEKILEEGLSAPNLEKYYGKGYGDYFEDRFANEVSTDTKNPLHLSFLHYMEQFVMSYEGTPTWKDSSARDVDNYVEYGDDYTWKNGYDTLIEYLTSSIPTSMIHLDSPIAKILWDTEKGNGVRVITEDNRCYQFDHVIVTMSAGYLKKHITTLFEPPLPRSLQSDFEGMKFGSSNKLIAGWPDFWWGKSNIEIQILWIQFDLPEEMDWLYGIVHIFRADEENPILMCFVTGNYSLKMEKLNDATVAEHFLFLIRKLFKNTDVPQPSLFKRTNWNSNPWTYGSFSSYITVEGEKSGLHSRESFRQPLVNKWNESTVFWAGEHTHDSRYGTVDGAYDSGIREANRIINISQ